MRPLPLNANEFVKLAQERTNLDLRADEFEVIHFLRGLSFDPATFSADFGAEHVFRQHAGMISFCKQNQISGLFG